MSAKAVRSGISLLRRCGERTRQRQPVRHIARRQTRFLSYEVLENRNLLASIVNVAFQFTDLAGTTPVPSLNTGGDYQLQVQVQDARETPRKGLNRPILTSRIIR